MFMNTTPGLSAALISSHISGKLYLKEDKLNFHFKLWLSSKLFYNIVEFVALENYEHKLNSSIVMLLALRLKYYCKLWFLSNLNPFQATLIHDYAQSFFLKKRSKQEMLIFPICWLVYMFYVKNNILIFSPQIIFSFVLFKLVE